MAKTTLKYLENCDHIETQGCIVNIRTGYDRFCRRVTHIEILPDDHYSGKPFWKLYGSKNNRVVELKHRKG